MRAPAFGDVNGVSTAMPVPVDTLIMIKDTAPNCVHNQDTLLTTMVMVVCFSICVQMAEGLHFGIVPYLSRPALGVVSGMVGAGGNAGALIAGQFLLYDDFKRLFKVGSSDIVFYLDVFASTDLSFWPQSRDSLP